MDSGCPPLDCSRRCPHTQGAILRCYHLVVMGTTRHPTHFGVMTLLLWLTLRSHSPNACAAAATDNTYRRLGLHLLLPYLSAAYCLPPFTAAIPTLVLLAGRDATVRCYRQQYHYTAAGSPGPPDDPRWPANHLLYAFMVGFAMTHHTGIPSYRLNAGHLVRANDTAVVADCQCRRGCVDHGRLPRDRACVCALYTPDRLDRWPHRERQYYTLPYTSNSGILHALPAPLVDRRYLPARMPARHLPPACTIRTHIRRAFYTRCARIPPALFYSAHTLPPATLRRGCADTLPRRATRRVCSGDEHHPHTPPSPVTYRPYGTIVCGVVAAFYMYYQPDPLF